jgi:P-type Ca2+ transporter type 2C
MVILEMVRLIDIRSYYKVSWGANPWLVVAIISSLVLQLAVIMIQPLANMFGAVPIALADWGIIALSGLVLLIAMRITNKILDIFMATPMQEKFQKPAQA